MRGDLDWIVMKALEKDRTRRYDTANGLARDIQRYLGNKPIEARPPSAVYRFQKLVRRNRLAVAAVSALALMLLAGLTTSTWLYLRATADLQRAVVAEQKATTVAQFLEGMLTDLNPAIAPGSHAKVLHGILDKTVERVATELTAQPEIEAEIWSLIGSAYLELLDYPQAEKMQREALRVRKAAFGERHSLVAASLNDLGQALALQGRRPEGEAFQRQALAIRRSLFGDEHPEVARSLTSLAGTLALQLKRAEAEELQREALAMQQKFLEADHPDLIASLNNLGRLLWDGGRLPEAEAAFRAALAGAKADQNLATSKAMVKLAKVLSAQGKLAEAEIVAREALALRRRLLDREHLLVREAFHDLVGLLQRQDRFGEVETLYRDRLQLMESQLPEGEPEITHTLVSFTATLIAAKKFAEAEPFARESLALREKQIPGDWRIFLSRSLLGAALAGQQKYAEAESWLLSGYEGLKQREATLPGYGQPYLRNVLQRLAEFYTVLNRTNQAAEWQQKLAAFDQAAAEARP